MRIPLPDEESRPAGAAASHDPLSAPGGVRGGRSLWRHRAFRLYLTGQAASVAGTSVGQVVIPILAVVELDATAGQVALLAFLGQLPPALFALHAGAMADRYSKQRQMITGDLVAAAAVATVPLAAVFGTLTLGHLMAVAVVQASASVLHDAAAISYLPSLVDRSLIQRSNSRIGALFAVAATSGHNVGAALAGAFGPARALTGDVLSYVVSAWCTARIKTPEPVLPPTGGRLITEIGAGLRYVFADVTLRTLTLVNATTSFALSLLNTLWALYLLRALGMGPMAFGVVMGLGALGAAAGALLAPRLCRRFGPGPMMLAALALTPLAQIPLLLAGPGRGWQIAIGAALVVQLCCAGAAGTTQRSIRQCVAEAGMQARMQAVSTWLTAGSRPVAALIAGGLGTWIGVRPTLAVGAVALFVPLLVLYCSPLRTLRQMPGAPTGPSHQGGDPMNQTPHPEPASTAALLVNDRSEYLLHLRDNIPGICHPGTWSLIGGHREVGESLEDTIARELLEEAGLAIADLPRFMITSSTGPDGTAKNRVQVFVGRWKGDADALPITEGIMFHWFPYELIDRLVTCPGTAEVIHAHRAQAAVPGPTAVDDGARQDSGVGGGPA